MVIDTIAEISLTDEDKKNYINELSSLENLFQGLNYLFHQISKFEDLTFGKKYVSVCIGNFQKDNDFIHKSSILATAPLPLITCAFHWYSITACNYIRLIGFIGNKRGRDNDKYLESVNPAMYRWRNKISAHFAKAKPLRLDSDADLILSTTNPLTCESGRWVVGNLQSTITNNNSVSRSTLLPWSLTETHEELAKRYNWTV